VKKKAYLWLVIPALSGALLAAGCSMMKPPATEPFESESKEKSQSEQIEKLYTNEQVVDAIKDVLVSPQFHFVLKRTDVDKAEVETQWRDEMTFEGLDSGVQGSEGKYRSYVVVSYDFKKNRIDIQRRVQYLDVSINRWREIPPRRYHRDEDMNIQKSIMDTLEARHGTGGETSSSQ